MHGFLPFALVCLSAALPTDDPLARFEVAWTAKLPWQTVVDLTAQKGESWDDKLQAAFAALPKTGGVVYLPAGTYAFTSTIRLPSGVILRGATPKQLDARKDDFAPPTRLIFPRYVPRFDGEGTPLDSAFKGIHLAQPGQASQAGLVYLALERGHVRFDDAGDATHTAGSRLFVVGCLLTNAAVADPRIPDKALKQPGWVRFTDRHHAAIHVRGSDLLIAANRLPQSGQENFTMKKVPVRQGKAEVILDEVVFDYDNRPGLYINDYGLGGAGASDPNGTPQTHPWGFRRGIIIRDNYLYHTGRCAIAFAGDGVVCQGNVVRFAPDVYRPTVTGRDRSTGASTNDNRAVQMRGWRWIVKDNDYVVHRNIAADRKYRINDGEGLMHEDHVNSTVKDSVLEGNRGNTYISIYKTAGIDGLIVRNNQIADGIMVVADRNKSRHECKNVRIENNLTSGGPIQLGGEPASNNVIRGNKSTKPAKLILRALAEVKDNQGFTQTEK
ncbi:MAG: glycosyl hydrolase family 28-related protein [Gemmataceae bacterium]